MWGWVILVPKYAGTATVLALRLWINSPAVFDSFKEERSLPRGSTGRAFSPIRQKLYLLKPTTYMNRSGQSIRAVLDWLTLEPASVLVVL